MRKLCLPTMIVFMLFVVQMAMSASDTATDSITMSVDEIAVLDVDGVMGELTITAPSSGGDDPEGDTDSNTYLQYTSTVESGDTRTINAVLGADESAPDGCLLKLRATVGSGDGEGTAAAQITLNGTVAQNIITSITSCATGTGGTDGARLTYTLEVDDPTELVANQEENVTITFTLTSPSS